MVTFILIVLVLMIVHHRIVLLWKMSEKMRNFLFPFFSKAEQEKQIFKGLSFVFGFIDFLRIAKVLTFKSGTPCTCNIDRGRIKIFNGVEWHIKIWNHETLSSFISFVEWFITRTLRTTLRSRWDQPARNIKNVDVSDLENFVQEAFG